MQRIWQSPFVIINHQTGKGAGVWMTSCPKEMVLGILGFWKDVSWVLDHWRCSCVFDRWGMQLSFSDLDRQRWIEILNSTRCALGWDQHSMVSIGFWYVSRSLHVAVDQSQKLINPFVSETKESTCIVYVSVLLTSPKIIQLNHQNYNSNILMNK